MDCRKNPLSTFLELVCLLAGENLTARFGEAERGLRIDELGAFAHLDGQRCRLVGEKRALTPRSSC